MKYKSRSEKNLFNELVDEALKNQPNLSSLKVVVEKELLHHDILRIMRDNNLMEGLTFIGGTCLRSCYGGIRLSEDLDFTGGASFSREQLSDLAKTLVEQLQNKYGLQVTVSEPVKDKQNVDTWKIKIETRKANKSLPAQRINIDICAVPSYEARSMMLLNLYGVDMGTSGLVIQAQSREEIYMDKLLAFAFRPNRIKHRDLWDIVWLHNKGVQPNLTLIPHKLKDRNLTLADFLAAFDERVQLLKNNEVLAEEFKQEMYRFLSPEQIKIPHFEQGDIWKFIFYLMDDFNKQIGQLHKKVD